MTNVHVSSISLYLPTSASLDLIGEFNLVHCIAFPGACANVLVGNSSLTMSAKPRAFQILWYRWAGQSTRPGLSTHTIVSWRSFNSSAFRCKAAKPTTPSPAKAAPKEAEEPSLQFAGRRPKGLGSLAMKISREGEVVLYKAPSQSVYLFTAYSLAAGCFAYSVYNSKVTFRDPIVPRPTWQKVLFGGICIMMSAGGTLLLTRTGNIIRNITAVKSQAGPQVRFTVRSTIPFKKPFQFEVMPQQIAFSRRLVVSPENMERYQRDSQRIGGANKPPPSFFKSPAKKLSYLLWKVFQSMRQVFTTEDIILLQVQGHNGTFRMDSNGFVARELLAIGNPVEYNMPSQN